MTEPTREEIKKIAQELAGAMQQGRDKEVSGLFAQIDFKIELMRKTQETIIKNEKEFQEKVLAELEEIKKRAVIWDLSSKGFLGMVGIAVTALFGAVVSFFIRHS